METIWVIHKATVMGNSYGDWQLHRDNMPAHASHLVHNFLVKHQIIQVTQGPYSPDLVPSDLCLFQKLKSPLKGKRFQTAHKIQENMMGQLMATGRIVWGSKVLLWGVIVLCTMFLVSCIFFNKCLYFFNDMAGYFLDKPGSSLTYILINKLYVCAVGRP